MNKHLVSLAFIALMRCGFCAWDQNALEDRIVEISEGEDDYVNNPMPPSVPEWRRDGLAEYGAFLKSGGWTTNRLIGALIQAVTNRQLMAQKSERDETIETTALCSLASINLPVAMDFIRQFTTNNVGERMGYSIAGVYRYSDYGEGVFDYLRHACLMTNQYAHCAGSVALGLERCIGGLSDAQKPAATNRVAKYHYFVLNHATADLGSVDAGLVSLAPPYSNSIQRLRAMRHITNTTTNNWVKRWTREEAERLEALPTNALNNVQWLEE